MKKIAVTLMILAIFSKFLGFFREIALSYFYGTSFISDAYLISLTIPGTIFAFIGVGIATTFIPLYNKIITDEDRESGDKFVNNILNILLIISSVIVLLTLFFTPFLVKLFASGFEGETLELAIYFTRITIFGVYFFGAIYVFEGYLRSNNSFNLPVIMGIPFNVIIILSIIASSKVSIEMLVYGNILAGAVQLLILFIFSKKKGYRYSFKLDFQNRHFRRMLYLSLPVILGTSVNQINKLVDKTLASQIIEGGISALHYAHRLDTVIQGVFVMSVATVMYSMISKMVAENNIEGLKKLLSEAIGVVNILVLPATIAAMIFAEPVVELLFGRGAFDAKAIFMTSNALFFYSIGMIGFGLREVLSRVFYSMQDTKTPMINAAIGMALNIILNIILSRYLGIGGLALATSLAAIFTTGLMFISLRKKIGPFGMTKITISFLKILFASLIMGVIAKLSFNYLTTTVSQNLSLLISISMGAVLYFVIIYFMKIEDVDVIVGAIKRKLGKISG